MKLKVYNKENAVGSFGKKHTEETVTFSKNGGLIRLSKSLIARLEIKVGDGIEIANEEGEAENWFFRISEDGIPLRSDKDDGSLSTNSSKICKDIMISFDTEKSTRMKVGKEPDEDGWLPLLNVSNNN